MIIRRLIIPGRYVQAHPYFDSLWLVTMEGELRAFDVHAYCGSRLNGAGSVAAKAFARNDGLVRSSGVLQVDDQTPDMRRFLLASADVEVSPPDVDEFSTIFAATEDLAEPIELRFYMGRAFASTNRGMFVFRAVDRGGLGTGPSGSGRRMPPELQRCTEAMPIQIQARLGAVSASCAEDGGFYGIGAASKEIDWRPRLRTFADASFGSEFAGAGLANLASVTDLMALKAEKIDVPASGAAKGEMPDRTEIVRIEGEQDADANLRFASAMERGSGNARPRRAFVTTQRAFVDFTDGSMANFSIADGSSFAHGPAKVSRREGPGGRVLSMSTTAGMVVAECRDRVMALAGNRWRTIYEGRAFSVRGYPQSRWYRNLVTIVGTDRVELVLLADDG